MVTTYVLLLCKPTKWPTRKAGPSRPIRSGSARTGPLGGQGVHDRSNAANAVRTKLEAAARGPSRRTGEKAGGRAEGRDALARREQEGPFVLVKLRNE